MQGAHISKNGGGGWIRTIEGNIQQIYSLPRLAASLPHHMKGSIHIQANDLECETKGHPISSLVFVYPFFAVFHAFFFMELSVVRSFV